MDFKLEMLMQGMFTFNQPLLELKSVHSLLMLNVHTDSAASRYMMPRGFQCCTVLNVNALHA